MESKNIFEMLPEQDSSEDEQKQKEKQKQKKQKERQDFQEKKKFAETQQKTIKGDAKKPAGYKSDQQKKQEKKISSDPHPLDRRSGTGRGKELKKQGGGAGNWGNTKDMVEEDKYVRKDETEQVESEEAKEEEKEALTLDDYMSKYKVEEKEEEKKKDIDLTQFIKEGCLVVTSKKDNAIDVDDSKKKKKKGGVKDYSAGMTTEHTELLGLKTGFKPLPEKKPRRQFEEKKEEVKDVKEKQEQEVKEEGNEPEKKEEQEEQQQQQQQHRGGKPFRGGRRGGRGGYQKRGNDVVDEKQKLKNVQKVIEDETNFPKLG